MNYNYELQYKAFNLAEQLRKEIHDFYYGFLMKSSNISPGVCFRGNSKYAEISLIRLPSIHMTQSVYLGVSNDGVKLYVIYDPSKGNDMSADDVNNILSLAKKIGAEIDKKEYSSGLCDYWTSNLNFEQIKQLCVEVQNVFSGHFVSRYSQQVPLLYDKEFFETHKSKHLGTTWKELPKGVLEYIMPNDNEDEVVAEEVVELPIHGLEYAIADYITEHDDEDLTADELVDILKTAIANAPKDSKTMIVHDFAMRYAPHLENCTTVAEMAGEKNNSAMLTDGKKLGMHLRSLIYPRVTAFPSSTYSEALISYLTAIRTKPFLLLAGISGTGKSRIVRKLAQATDDIDTFAKENDRWKLHSPANFELIQVKPNWHNSMDVVGFKSNIGNDGEHYEYTPFVEFIAKAWKHTDTPFFLCLDEMNLAPVEEYFAEFLSAIESRSKRGDSYETDPIIKPFRDFGEKVAREMLQHLLDENLLSLDDDSNLSAVGNRFLNKGMTLPKNLIVMGTVNMDETTFSFSRKVLDRAMSIEMNEVMYDDFLAGKTEDDIPNLTERNNVLVDRPIKGLDVKDGDSQSVIDYLKSINMLLDGTPFKLGYRAANEALLYVAAAKIFGVADWKASIDDFTLMKILSRIEGDESKLRTQSGDNLLEKLSELLEKEHSFDPDKSKTMVKLNQMINTLDRDKFVSFWG